MNNKIVLKGRIKDIQDNHEINGVEYQKANIIVPYEDIKKGISNYREDLITLKFKKIFNTYKNGDEIIVEGNLRSFSQKFNDKSKVELYVFTLFQKTEERADKYINEVEIDGYICKKTDLRITKSGKDVLDFVLANNLSVNDTKTLNCYIPTVAWGEKAKELNNYKVGDYIKLKGRLQSREYKKILPEDKIEIRVAHELSVSEIIKD